MTRGRREAFNARAPQETDRDREVSRLQRQMEGMEQELQVLTSLMQSETSPQSQIQKSTSVRDQPWRCENCKSLLGWYNADKEIMRIRYKQQMIYVRVGVGGFLQSICPGCSEPNILKYEEKSADKDEVDE